MEKWKKKQKEKKSSTYLCRVGAAAAVQGGSGVRHVDRSSVARQQGLGRASSELDLRLHIWCVRYTVHALDSSAEAPPLQNWSQTIANIFFYIFLSIWVGWLHHGEPESPPLLSPRGWNWVHFLVFLTSNGTSASHTVCGHSNQLKVRYYWRKARRKKIIYNFPIVLLQNLMIKHFVFLQLSFSVPVKALQQSTHAMGNSEDGERMWTRALFRCVKFWL